MFGSRALVVVAATVAAVLTPAGAASATQTVALPAAEQTVVHATYYGGGSVVVSVGYDTINGGKLEVKAVKPGGNVHHHPFSVLLYPAGRVSARVNWAGTTARVVVDGQVISEFWPQGKNANPAYKSTLGPAVQCHQLQRTAGTAIHGIKYVRYRVRSNILRFAVTAGGSEPSTRVGGFMQTTVTWDGNYPRTTVVMDGNSVHLGYDRRYMPIGTSRQYC